MESNIDKWLGIFNDNNNVMNELDKGIAKNKNSNVKGNSCVRKCNEKEEKGNKDKECKGNMSFVTGGDMSLDESKLDLILERYEDLFGKEGEEGGNSGGKKEEGNVKGNGNDNRRNNSGFCLFEENNRIINNNNNFRNGTNNGNGLIRYNNVNNNGYNNVYNSNNNNFNNNINRFVCNVSNNNCNYVKNYNTNNVNTNSNNNVTFITANNINFNNNPIKNINPVIADDFDVEFNTTDLEEMFNSGALNVDDLDLTPIIEEPPSKQSKISPINNNNNTNNTHNNNNNTNIKTNTNTKNNSNSFIERPCSNHTLADMKKWSQPFPWDADVNSINLQYFGYHKFRPNQREIINANLSDHDIFVCMPTGGGKSLTFQIPAILNYGVTLVVMPLLSLIQDQTTYLRSLGVNVLFLNTMGTKRFFTKFDELFYPTNSDNLCKMIFLTPEKIAQSTKTMNYLKQLYDNNLLRRCVIDECHCVCQWGNEFRADYLNLKTLRTHFPNLPILAVTATAPNKIREDVINQLNMCNTIFFRSSYNRTNLDIEIRNKSEYKNEKGVIDNIATFINSNYPHSTGLIYCSSRNKCEHVCDILKSKYKMNVAYYHAQMSESKKNEVQNKWKNDQIKLIVATVAFGMGINKADVRYVIHYSMPKSFEGYYQEIGRAGRDNEKSHCILYYSYHDRKCQEFLITKTNLKHTMITHTLRQLTEMIDFCEETCECRRVIALKYFDEVFDRKNCNRMCDNCKKNISCEARNVINECVVVVEFINNCTCENIEITLCYSVDYLRGKAMKKEKALPKKDTNKGKLDKVSKGDLQKIIRKLIIWGYIDEELVVNGEKNIYTILKCSYKGKELLMKVKNGSVKELLIEFPVSNSSKDVQVLSPIKSKSKKHKPVIKEQQEVKRYSRNYNYDNETKQNDSNGNNTVEYDEEFGLCTKEQFDHLFNKLKTKRVEILSSENTKLKQNSTDNDYTTLCLNDIFPENGLRELCRKLPTEVTELQDIYGVSKAIKDKYGKEFLDIIKTHISVYEINKSGLNNIKEKERKSLSTVSMNKKRKERISESNKSEFDSLHLEGKDIEKLLEDAKEMDEMYPLGGLELNGDEPIENELQINEMKEFRKEAEKLLNINKAVSKVKKKSNNGGSDSDSDDMNDNDSYDGNDENSNNNNYNRNKYKTKKIKSSSHSSSTSESSRQNYFKQRAVWNKINQYKKRKKGQGGFM